MTTLDIAEVDGSRGQAVLAAGDVVNAENKNGAPLALPAFWISPPKGGAPGAPAGLVRPVAVRLDPASQEDIRRLEAAVRRAKKQER
jgi:hypothetical protein